MSTFTARKRVAITLTGKSIKDAWHWIDAQYASAKTPVNLKRMNAQLAVWRTRRIELDLTFDKDGNLVDVQWVRLPATKR